MKSIINTGLLLTAFTLLFSSCEKDDPVIPHEEELITTLRLEMVSDDGIDSLTFEFVDLDGDGGQDPVISAPELAANTLYHSSIHLFNESENPAEEITDEIKSEGTEHQFFFQSDISESVDFAYQDEDVDGKPIGLEFSLSTKDANSGKFTIILKHEPVKDAEGVATGAIENAGGEIDIEVEFDLIIK